MFSTLSREIDRWDHHRSGWEWVLLSPSVAIDCKRVLVVGATKSSDSLLGVSVRPSPVGVFAMSLRSRMTMFFMYMSRWTSPFKDRAHTSAFVSLAAYLASENLVHR